jgi:adenine-specific DNA-methyltransferase
MLKPRGVLSYIATNNWTTSAGASKLRNRIVRDTTLIEFIDFEHHRIFEDASIQTMIMTLRKDASRATYRATIARPTSAFTTQDMSTLARFPFEMDRLAQMDKPLSFNPAERASILNMIAEAGDFRLLKAEIAQGIVPNPDRVNARNIDAIGHDIAIARGIEPGDGVFVLNESECASIDRAEHGILKPLVEPIHLGKYRKRPSNLKIIYAKKGSFDATRAPSIVAHLSRFKEIMQNRRENRTGQLAFHHLHWPRDEAFFAAGEKILAPRKCVSPLFLHTEDEAYVMLSINVIRTRRIDMRYLSAVLNSSVVRYWLRHCGNRQGVNFQIDAAPLQNIPIASATHEQREVIAKLVRIVQREASLPIESLIDACVIECYFGAQDESFIADAAAHLDDAPALCALAADLAQRPKRAEWLAVIESER